MGTVPVVLGLDVALGGAVKNLDGTGIPITWKTSQDVTSLTFPPRQNVGDVTSWEVAQLLQLRQSTPCLRCERVECGINLQSETPNIRKLKLDAKSYVLIFRNVQKA